MAIAACAVLSAGCTTTVRPGSAPAAAASARVTTAQAPSLVLFITVDQLRPEYLELYGPQFTGGLARLLKGGAWFINAFHDHAITETAPGHASTLSGRFPRSTGIVANAMGVNTPDAPLLDVEGDGASPFRFRGTTLGDWMKARDPRTRTLSVSRKDRSAILPLGRGRSPYWYSRGLFTTSRYYADTLPSWVRAFNARELPKSYAGTTWRLLLPESAYNEPDTVRAESRFNDIVFPHPLPSNPDQTVRALYEYPMMDDVTLQFAMAGVQALELGGDTSRTDLLAISLSTTDAVGHRWGPDSRELHDQMLRLDRYLGAFLDSLYKVRDSTRIVITLTSDHGVAPIADSSVATRYRPPGTPVGYVNVLPTIKSIYRDLARAGVASDAYRWEEDFLILDPEGFVRAGVNRDSAAKAIAAQLTRVAGVLRADVVSELATRDTTRDAIARRWLHMLPPDMHAAVAVSIRPFWSPRYGTSTATHGTPHDYDAHVPVLFHGSPFVAGRYDEFARVVDMAPTLAAILGVPPLERLDGRVLRRAIR